MFTAIIQGLGKIYLRNKPKTRMVKISVNFKGIESWNALPKIIRESVSLNVLKRRLKKPNKFLLKVNYITYYD